ncbi:carbohydrate ABC transporter permease [Streptomyces sp. NPDC047002]|uniref:carbohydrate ABC transporter permease n=1 Tax=Streptomyces sp. NPDC047002 TaxID=3155475 RepID=UPI0034533A7D
MTRYIRPVTVVVLSLLWLVPTYLLVVNGIVSSKDYSGTVHWLPTSFGFFDNVRQAWQAADLGPAMLNSALYATVSGALAVFVAAMAAFAATVLPGRGKVLWFWAIYVGSLFPAQAFLRPLFNGFASTGLYDTRLGLFVIYAATCVPFSFFILRNTMRSLPTEVAEAARMDGASWTRMFFSIHLPLVVPSLVAAFIFQFVWVWNELLFGITLSFSGGVRPVMAALAGLQGSYSTVGPPVVLAGALLVSVPTVAVFLAFQRMFVSSLKANV